MSEDSGGDNLSIRFEHVAEGFVRDPLWQVREINVRRILFLFLRELNLDSIFCQ